MIGSMLEGKHKGKPILIFTVLNATPHPKALFVRADGTMRVDYLGSVRTAGGAVLVGAPDDGSDDPAEWITLTSRGPDAREQADLDPLPMPLQPVLVGEVLGASASDRAGLPGVAMNGAGNIAGLLTEVLPAATVVEQMAAEAAARLTAR